MQIALRVARRLALGVSGLVILGCVTAPAAAAHDAVGSGTPSTNYAVRVTHGPELDGVTLSTRDGSYQLELTNVSDATVTVLDYVGKPYLRVGPDGVFENVNSMAVHLNQSPDLSSAVPDGAGVGPTRWKKLSADRTARWHDHRTHWMAADPPEVRSDPDEAHVVAEWSVPLEVAGDIHEVSGTIEWVPPPSPWPFIVLAASVAATVLVLLLISPARSLIAMSVAVSMALAVHELGVWGDSTEGVTQRLPIVVLPVLVLALFAATAWTFPRSHREGSALALGAAGITAFLAIAGAGTWLFTSQLPTALSSTAARMIVALLIGLSLGLAVWAVAGLTAARGSWRSAVVLRRGTARSA